MLSCGAEPLILIQELNKFSNEFDVIVLELHSDDGLFRGKSSLNRTTSFWNDFFFCSNAKCKTKIINWEMKQPFQLQIYLKSFYEIW